MKFLSLHSSPNTRISPISRTRHPQFSLHTTKPLKIPNFPHLPQPPLRSPIRILHQFKLSSRTCCLNESNEPHFDPVSKIPEETLSDSVKNNEGTLAARSLRNAAWIGAATIASKILGLLREIVVAAVFGVGPVATAFKHASVVPGFYIAVMGGVNGPIHIITATTLSKLSKERGRKLIQSANFIMFLIGGVLGAIIFIFAESIIYVSAPGLWIMEEGRITREIAICQLKLMIPCMVFSGLVGLGFGCMSAEGDNIFACISPSLSSICIIALCVAHVSIRGLSTSYLDGGMFGGILLSCGASLGAFFQWLLQVLMHDKTKDSYISLSWPNIFNDKDVHKFFKLVIPASLTSWMAHIASFTDLYFASFIPGAAAGLSYAHLLAMAPLGILSSMIILPQLPTFSKLSQPSTWPSMIENVKQAVLLCLKNWELVCRGIESSHVHKILGR